MHVHVYIYITYYVHIYQTTREEELNTKQLIARHEFIYANEAKLGTGRY